MSGPAAKDTAGFNDRLTSLEGRPDAVEPLAWCVTTPKLENAGGSSFVDL